ncbi:hypothetical protein ACFPM3_32385 [Streptomyces coeruleoprunus]|uniref:DUF308 domain-containing protein n=1 Tax=Streptomyces coeruleoprunus TaxID=285563 RepID=A0ABV9XRQ0_9ACTN
MAEQHDADRDKNRDPLDEEAAWAAIVAGYGEEPPDPPGARPFRSVEDLALPEEDVLPEKDNAAKDNVAKDGTPEDGTAKDGTAENSADDAAAEDAAEEDAAADDRAAEDDVAENGKSERPALGSSVVFAPGVGAMRGPRDYSVAEPKDDDLDESDEGHFVPPEPPPLPEADAAAKFAWLGVIGGPVLLLVAVLLQWDMTWWLTTVCVGGFLGGFATLFARMKHGDDEDDDDPGRGAVV